MKINSLQDLYLEQLKDLYDAEQQLIKALPKMAKAASSEELRSAFEDHLEQTRGHAERLEQIFDMMGEPAKTKKCEAMDGLIKESRNIIDETDEGTATRDAAIIMAVQKMEHYEIATYGSLVQLAKTIGMNDVADLLDQTLAEEKEADNALTQIAESNINEEGAQERGRDQQMEEGNEGEED